MVAVKGRGVIITSLVLMVLASVVTSQITFSRDWTGGKRAAPIVDCGQFARLCRHFLHEMKTSMADPESRPAKRRRSREDDAPPLYDDE